MELEAGRLLIASPTLVDPNFARSLVLLLNVDEEGALGVVLNRPSLTAVAEVLGEWGPLVRSPDVLFQGGPVDTDSALGLAQVSPTAAAPVGWRVVFDRTAIVDLDTPTELIASGLDAVRIYAGYAGWSTGQLEAEIDEGAWHVVDAEEADLCSPDPDQLWPRVLRRQSGDLRLLATMPTDPTLN
jgi:putative transcriptional regulator